MDDAEYSPRPAKRVRFEEPADMAEPVDDLDDIYEAGEGTAATRIEPNTLKSPSDQSQNATLSSPSLVDSIPGLGMLASVTQPQSQNVSSQTSIGDNELPDWTDQTHVEGMAGNYTPERLDSGHPILEHGPIEEDGQEEAVDRTVEVQGDAEAGADSETTQISETPGIADGKIKNGMEASTEPKIKNEVIDSEFLEAALNNKDNEAAEWQYDSSDAESTSTDSSDDTTSDEDSDDEDFEALDPAAVAKMLMAEEGEDEDGQQTKVTGNHQPRTKNEKPPEVVPKPDVQVTPDMKITPLGLVENVVDSSLLIKAQTSGEYQVLEQASVLCLEDRSVIGVVAETFGRVQEPMYSVSFTTAQDIADAGISRGTHVFYVDAHSTFVFTQPLKNLKGTDASNLYDEEVGDHEMEFSDDEAEAAYKRAKKDAKRGGRGGANFQPRARDEDYNTGYDQVKVDQPLSYDDGDGEDMYTPLSRPTNLQDMMAAGHPPVEQRNARPQFDRGRGRGGRGRGDRGRGDRGRGMRGGRGGGDGSRHRGGVSKSFPDSHNSFNYPDPGHQPTQQTVTMPQNWQAPVHLPQPPFPPPPPTQYGQQTQQSSFQQYQLQNAIAAYQQQIQQQPAWPQHPQQQHQQQQSYGTQAQQPFPGGAYINPSFFPGQQPQQAYTPPVPNQHSPPGGHDAYQAAQQQLELLRRLGGGS